MVKYFKYIFFGLICFICFGETTYASNTCTYYFDIYGAGAYEEGHRIEMDVEIDYYYSQIKVNGMVLKELFVNSEYNSEEYPKKTYTSDGKTVEYYIALGGFNFPDAEDPNIDLESCPKLYAKEIEYKYFKDLKGTKYVLELFDEDNAPSGAVATNSKESNDQKLKIKENIILGDETLYKVNFNRCDATTKDSETSKKCDDMFRAQQGSIYIKVSKDGTYNIGIDQEYSGVNESNENVWEGTYNNKKFVIRQSEWSQIKSEFVFNSSITEDISKSLVITPKDNYYVISLDGISDGDGEETEARGDTSILDDDRYNFTIIYKNVSDKVGTCVDYLGHADGKENGEPTVAYYLQMAFNLVKVGSIVLCIVFSMLDFSAAITSAKTDVNKTAIKCVKRLVVVIVLLLLPTFIDMLGSIVGVEDILCGIK